MFLDSQIRVFHGRTITILRCWRLQMVIQTDRKTDRQTDCFCLLSMLADILMLIDQKVTQEDMIVELEVLYLPHTIDQQCLLLPSTPRIVESNALPMDKCIFEAKRLGYKLDSQTQRMALLQAVERNAVICPSSTFDYDDIREALMNLAILQAATPCDRPERLEGAMSAVVPPSPSKKKWMKSKQKSADESLPRVQQPKYCGHSTHTGSKCPAADKECRKCGKTGGLS
eukprot:GHVR01154848.1.p1 GENE.GHVR01154848.1~~GHVR01154848.1.p1  ORF type:complete len:228 (+),score=27.67 GHVR01154848.1:156-839(+)